MPACDTDVHHIVFWTDGGLTEPSNLASLCAFHHQRLHEGAFHILVDTAGVVEFRTAQGKPIEAAPRPLLPEGFDGALWLRQLSVLAGRVIDSETAVAQDRGGAFDLGHSEVISGSVALAAARASPA